MDLLPPDSVDNPEQISSFNISLGDFESHVSLDVAQPVSPEAPPFSPITPQFTHSVMSAADIPVSSVTSVVPPPLATSSPKVTEQSKWSGFKVVIDNIDMNLRPRYQTFERQMKSIHYVNSYAVRDRVDLSSYSSTAANSGHNVVPIESLLPDEDDRRNILANFVVLAGRILCESLPALREIPDLATNHILHIHSKEMSSKSEIVRKPTNI